jgi:phosphatidylglycerol lysyltransferase
MAYLALLGDKRLLFSRSGRSFLMYAVQGRTWVALGDPVGPAEEHAELCWRFREACDRHRGRPCFYLAGRGQLPLYVDLGLSLLKLGEEAIVPLAGFTLEGGARKPLRRALNAARSAGCRFEVLEGDEVRRAMPELRAVSDAWLARKRTREKGFSLGWFQEAYVAALPVAAARLDGRIVAFATVWAGPEGTELSVDLMRYLPGAPDGVMDFVLLELMMWGRARGYAAFNLGMAPLSGLEARKLAPLWSRAGALVYRLGEHFYNFRGLRHYKEKFDPEWRPRYLASPGGLAVPGIAACVATLVGGGPRGVVAR